MTKASVDVAGASGVAAGGGTGAVAAGADVVAQESLTSTTADLCPLGTRSNASVVALPFFSARRATFAASSMEVVTFEVAFLGAIAGTIFRSTNDGRQMLTH